MSVSTRNLVLASLTAACWAVSGGVAAVRAQNSGNGALHILADATEAARTTWARMVGQQPRNPPGAAQYQDGLTRLRAGQYADALTPLQAAVRLNGNNAIYHSDLAAAYAGIERWDDAALEFVRARQIQPGNQWFTVALAAVKAEREQWSEAALNLDAAVAADSSLIDSVLAEAAVSWAWRARRMSAVTAWAEIATTRWPGIAEPWFRLASVYQQRADTARGLEAIRRYVALRPSDPTGRFLHAVFLYYVGQNDSALVSASEAVQDSLNRERASEVLFGIGARALQASNTDTALLALTRAQAGISTELRPRLALFLGYAQMQRVAVLDQLAEQNRQCDAAMQLDSLVVLASQNLTEGMALDSARVAPIVNQTLPAYRTRAGALVSQVCRNRRP